MGRIRESLKQGNPLSVVAAQAGISRRTFYNYLEKGRKARALRERGDEDTDALTPWDDTYIELANMVDSLEADIQQMLYERIRDAGEDTWTANAWILERRWPEEWSKEHRHKVVGERGGPVEFTLSIGKTPDEAEEEEIQDADYEIIEED